MSQTAILLATSNNLGNTKALIEVVSSLTKSKVYNLKDYSISPFDYAHKNLDDDFIGLVTELLKYQHIVFASPVYWYTMCAQMKVFFDRVSDLLQVKKDLGRRMRDKTCALIATGSSAVPERSFEEVFINSFDYLGMHYKGLLYCCCEDKFVLNQHQNYINSQLKKLQV